MGEAIESQEIFLKMVKRVDCIFFSFVYRVSLSFMDLLDKDVMAAKIRQANELHT